MTPLPNPESTFLKDVIESIRKRSKSLNYNSRQLSLERVIIKEGGTETEKLEFAHRGRTPNSAPSVRLFIWEDRWCWVDTRQSSKNGWVWEWQLEGRVSGHDMGKRLIVAFQDTIGISGSMTRERIFEFDQIWKPILFTGQLDPV